MTVVVLALRTNWHTYSSIQEKQIRRPRSELRIVLPPPFLFLLRLCAENWEKSGVTSTSMNWPY
ncbi:MAG: hypothetical protein BWX69_01423 [Planctomycetes bacterium ADurb.Bin069]|nr:MAG: hypothetical protein BWX69_01423 [Planctomycetes bacterium ADurb.Bin069]